MKTIQGVIFDMDGLLVDTEKLYYKANHIAAKSYGIDYTQDYYMKLVGISDADTFLIYQQDFPHLSKEELEEFVQLGYKEVEQLFEAGEAKLKPGALELLTYLKAEKIPMVVASSNLRRYIDLLLERNQIAHFFTDIVSGEDVKRAKPDPEIVDQAVAKLAVPAANTLMLEDSKNGVLAANQAGVPVIMVPDLIAPTKELKEQVLGVFESLTEVKNYLISEQ